MSERSRKFRAASVIARPGAERKRDSAKPEQKVFRLKRKENHPGCAQLRMLRGIFLVAQPPLLAMMQGGEYASPTSSANSYTGSMTARFLFCNTLRKEGNTPILKSDSRFQTLNGV
jgi:hypothetical protein